MNLTAQSNQSGKSCFNYKPERTGKASVQLSGSGALRLQLAKHQNHSQRPWASSTWGGPRDGWGALCPASSRPVADPARPFWPDICAATWPHPPPLFQPRKGITDSFSQELIKGLLSVTFSETSFNILSICPHSQSRENPAAIIE